MTRLQIEGLLAAFPKLLGSDWNGEHQGGIHTSTGNKNTQMGDSQMYTAQHTFIETESVRYLYQPMEQLYLILITNKQSNIMEDLDTLRLCAKLIPEYCEGHDEAAVKKNLYKLIFAFDEVISLGYRENVTLQQIKTFTEMDSHEEKLQKIILESKMNEARDVAQQKADSIEKQKKERYAMERLGGGRGQMESFGSGENRRSKSPDMAPVQYAPEKLKEIHRPSGAKGVGMSLSKKKDQKFVEALSHEERIVAAPTTGSYRDVSKIGKSEPTLKVVRILIDEQISVHLERDGSLAKMEVKGDLKVIVVDPDQALLTIQCALQNLDAAWKGKAVAQFRPHPRMNVQSWNSENKLVLKDFSKAYSVGSDNPTGILKWRIAVNDAELVPLSINFWPSSENGRCVVTVEFNMPTNFLKKEEPFVLQNVIFTIPYPTREAPDVTQCDGNYNHIPKDGVLLWRVDEITPGSSGILEFSLPDVDNEKFFPVSVRFNSTSTFSGLQATALVHAENQSDIPFAVESSCQVEKFVIE